MSFHIPQDQYPPTQRWINKLRNWFVKDAKGLGQANEIQLIRDRLFDLFSVLLLYLAGPAIVYGSFLFYRTQQYLYAMVELSSYFILILVIAVRAIPRTVKKGIIFTIIYLGALGLTLTLGPRGAGLLTLSFVFIMAVAVLRNRTTLILIGINFIVLVVLTYLMANGSLDAYNISEFKNSWLIDAVSTQIAIISLYFLWSFIFARLGVQIDRFEASVTGSNDGIWYLDLLSNQSHYSKRWLNQLGYTEADHDRISQDISPYVHPEDLPKLKQSFEDFTTRTNAEVDLELRMLHKDGSYRWMRVRGSGSFDKQGRPLNMAGSQTDITQSKETQQQLKASETLYRMIADNIADVIWVLDVESMRFSYISPSCVPLLGYSVDEVLSMPMKAVLTEESTRRVQQNITENAKFLASHADRETQSYNLIQMIRKDGAVIWTEYSGKYRYNAQGTLEVVGVSRDVTERKLKEEQIQYLSFYDSLTSMLNRNSMRSMMTELDSFKRRHMSVIVVNVDNFKMVNELLGQSNGDLILRDMADKIQQTLYNQGTAYYGGADEFIIFTDELQRDRLVNLATYIQQAIGRQIRHEKQRFTLTASVGIAIASTQISQETCYKHANMALAMAKRKKNHIEVYSSQLDELQTRESIIRSDLASALDEDEFYLQYQPIVHLESSHIHSVEALVRWHHPDIGLISPLEFIPIAEASKLIIPLTELIIRKGVQQLNEWDRMGLKDLRLNINLSIVSMDHKGQELIQHLSQTVTELGIDPKRLVLEITESSLMENPRNVIQLFHQLKSIGHTLSLDDFGSGYSSFGYLVELPVDNLKLDHSLMRHVMNSEREQAIVKSMIDIAHQLKLTVIAEYVETLEQLELLNQYGCDYGQGYYFSKPMNPSDVFDFVKKYNQ